MTGVCGADQRSLAPNACGPDVGAGSDQCFYGSGVVIFGGIKKTFVEIFQTVGGIEVPDVFAKRDERDPNADYLSPAEPPVHNLRLQQSFPANRQSCSPPFVRRRAPVTRGIKFSITATDTKRLALGNRLGRIFRPIYKRRKFDDEKEPIARHV